MLVEETRSTQSRTVHDFVSMRGWFDRYRSRFDEYLHNARAVVDWVLNRTVGTTTSSVGERYYTFKLALNWYLQHGGSNIIETGSLREPGSWYGVGCSTYLFGQIAETYGGHFWTCDISADVIEKARQATTPFHDQMTFVCDDSVRFLRDFDAPIDLLYLDSMDCPRSGDAFEAQQHNLRELEAAFPKLSDHAVVLLDDNRFENGGKPLLSKDFLVDQGWVCLLDWHQSVWVRGYVR